MVFEGSESKNIVKILVPTFLVQKTHVFWGAGPPKSNRKLKLSDFDEIWYPGVFEGADFKNRILGGPCNSERRFALAPMFLVY